MKEYSESEFLKCCGSKNWASTMENLGPYNNRRALLDTARQVWASLSEEDWLEAFAAHPKIGDRQSLKAKFQSTGAWAESEQAGMNLASDQIFADLEKLNQDYENKFGFIFIICATGKSAFELLSEIKKRVNNTRDQEISNAADEQLKILQIRLDKLLDSGEQK